MTIFPEGSQVKPSPHFLTMQGDLSKLLKQRKYDYAKKRVVEFRARHIPTQHIYNEILHLFAVTGDEENANKV